MNVAVQLLGLAVTGLHGILDIDVPIQDNRLVLVGVNGLGKSTFVNLLYYVLSRQWSRLVEVDFDSLKLKTTGGDIVLTHTTIEQNLNRREFRQLPSSVLNTLERLREQGILEAFIEATPSELTRFEDIIRFPSAVLQRLQLDARRWLRTTGAQAKEIERASDVIKEILGQNQILYLPTYRRIEKRP